MTFEEQYQGYLVRFESALREYQDRLQIKPDVLKESMLYSLTLGGKRIRPVLFLATYDMLGGKNDVMPFALAIEMIHTYSLIHDDLPAMDNDDFRRGKPSNHKVYGEANAILAGDALLNTAFEICLQECKKGDEYIDASRFLAYAAGINGMIAGQSADLLNEGKKEIDEDELKFIYHHKTGLLLIAPITMAAYLCDRKYIIDLGRFSSLMGRLFQLTDDILDEEGTFEVLGKTIGKDKQEEKLTAVKLYGLTECKLRADFLAEDCHQILDGVPKDTSFLHGFVDFVKNRKK